DEPAQAAGHDVGELVADEAGAGDGRRGDDEQDSGDPEQGVAGDPVPGAGQASGGVHEMLRLAYSALRQKVDAARRMAPAAASTAISTRPGFFRSSRARAAGSDATSRDASGAAGAPSSAGTAGEDAAWPVSAPPGSAAPPLRGEDVA